jgi:hypothetical protein
VNVRSIPWAVILAGSLTAGLRGDDPPAAPESPREVIRLFNGKDLSGLTTWIKDSGREDPRRVFSVTGDGQIHITGDGLGYLATRKAYRDYRVVVEFRWGEGTNGHRGVRNSGLLMHAVGPDGGAGQGTWMASVECQIAQGCVGDLIPIPGVEPDGKIIHVKFIGDSAMGPDKRPRWRPGGIPLAFDAGQLWWSNHEVGFQEMLDARGKDDVESPKGEWTRVECTCQGNKISVRVNGVFVNECRDVTPSAGKILLQSEGFEIFVRKFELQPIP